MRSILIFVLISASVWLALSHFGPTDTYEELVRTGVVAQAVVVKLDCENHGSFVYAFDAGGQRFQSRDRASSAGTQCSNIQVGSKLDVYYVPANPSLSSAGAPKSELRNERTFNAMASLLVPGVILWSLARRKKLENDA